MTIVAGIDPGMTGGMVIVRDGCTVMAMAMPIKDGRPDVAVLAQALLGMQVQRVVVERQFGSQQVGADRRLINYGFLLGALTASGYDVVELDAGVWRTKLGLTPMTGQSRAIRQQATLDRLGAHWLRSEHAEGVKCVLPRARKPHSGILAAHAIARATL
jgi:hypothetical protein